MSGKVCKARVDRKRANYRVGVAAMMLCALALAGATTAALPAEQEEHEPEATQLGRITLVKNKSNNIRLHESFSNATVGAPDIVDIVPVSDRQLYVVGKQTGTTNIMFYDRTKHLIGVVDVEVKLDTGHLGRKIREVTGGADIRVHDVGGRILLSGNGGDPQTIERAMDVAGGLGGAPVVNAMKLKANQQVLLQVRFVEANRSAARSLGVRWQGLVNNRVAGVVGTQTATSRLGAAGLIPGFSPRPGGPVVPDAGGLGAAFDTVGSSLSGASPVATILAQVINSNRVGLDVVLSALEEKGVVRRLAEPNLVALSGESAEFLAGGEFPVPIAQTSTAGAAQAAITVQWKEWGVRLRFTPTVLSGNVISLKLEPEVSDLDYARGVQINGTTIPGLLSRRARTTVELRDGQSFAIAGLIEARSDRTIDQVPWLGSVPVLGALFRSSEFAQGETELVALVTPHLVRPSPPGNMDPRLKTPLDATLAGNDLDFFLGGAPELEKRTPIVISRHGKPQPAAGAISNETTGSIPKRETAAEPQPVEEQVDPVTDFLNGVKSYLETASTTQ